MDIVVFSGFIRDYFEAEHIAPQALDSLWAHGWRHFGTLFYRYNFTPEPSGLGEVLVKRIIPLRLSPACHELKRSQKRVLKRNADAFLEWGEARVDDEVDAIFRKHITRFEHNVPQSLFDFLSRNPAQVPCQCLNLRVFVEGELVGVSYLDIGETGCSSVYQCFDPAHGNRSLGVLMILASIQFAREQGLRYYYPGYATIESSAYDYKRTLGAIEFYDWEGVWRPLNRGEGLLAGL